MTIDELLMEENIPQPGALQLFDSAMRVWCTLEKPRERRTVRMASFFGGNMQVISGQIEAPLLVSSALEVRGTVAGSVTVQSGADFVLRGVCRGNVRIAYGGRAQLWGVVEGDVVNEGGTVSIWGIVEGVVHGTRATSHVSSDSLVRGGVRE
jgi:hypothetical protein